MPMENGRVITNFSEIEETEKLKISSSNYKEAEKYYQLTSDKDFPEWSTLSYNKKHVKLVAIDGQHRLKL